MTRPATAGRCGNRIQPHLITWSVISGTGTYAGMAGGGSIEVTARGAGELAVNWFGTIRLGVQ